MEYLNKKVLYRHMQLLSHHKCRAFELNIVHILIFLLPKHVSFSWKLYVNQCTQEVQFLDHAQVSTWQMMIDLDRGWFNCNPNVKFQRGLSEAQNGYGSGMLPGHGRPDGQFSSLALDGSPACNLHESSMKSLKLFIAPELDVHTRSATVPNHKVFGVLVLL